MRTFKHFTLNDRITIQVELAKKSSFAAISSIIHKDPTSISREIRSHLVTDKVGAVGYPYNACIHRFQCDKKHICSSCQAMRRFKKCRSCRLCNLFCPDFQEQKCPKLEKPPYVCNGCGTRMNCTLTKKFYRAETAQGSYRETLSEHRKGFNLTEEELRYLDDFLSPLIKQGQSPHHICMSFADQIMISESTIYRMVDQGLLEAGNIDLPRKVRFRIRKCKVHKKVDPKCRIGRTYECFLKFQAEHPGLPLVELDSVEGSKGGKVLLTIHFVQCEMMLAFIRDHNDSASVIDIFESLYRIFPPDLFRSVFSVCLADNGSEFSNPKRLETDENGQRRTRIFYCDPGRPDQKGSAERNHEFIRCFIPKGKSLDPYTQDDIRLMMDHINSYRRESLGGRSPYEMFAFMYGEKILEDLKCHLIPPQEVTLKKTVFRKEVQQ